MKYLLTILLFFIISLFSFGQSAYESPFQVAHKLFNSDTLINYLQPVSRLEKIKNKYDSLDQLGYWQQAMATYYSFLGNIFASYECLYSGSGPSDELPLPSPYYLRPASNAIVTSVEGYRILALNESHNMPYHRIFASTLLKPLKEKGFTHFAVEAINSRDSLLSQRGYPISSSGFYVKEPFFANLIRRAISLGYKIVPYEIRAAQEKTFSDPHRRVAFRDSIHAVNIASVFNTNLHAKVFMYAGYDHIYKGISDNNLKRAAHILNDFYKLPTLSIDQVQMNGARSDLYQNGFYKYLLQKTAISQPVCLLLESGKWWVSDELAGKVDIQVFHPRIDEDVSFQSIAGDQIKSIIIGPLISEKIMNAYYRYDAKLLQLYVLREYEKHGGLAIPVFQKVLEKNLEMISFSVELNEEPLVLLLRDTKGSVHLKEKLN